MTAEAEPARRYARLRYRLALIEMAGWLVFLLAYQTLGASRIFADAAARLSASAWWQLAAYLTVFGLVSYLVFLPLHLYGDLILEHRFGLSRMSVSAWCVREMKSLALGGCFSLALTEGLYALIRQAPAWWPALAAAAWVLISIALARIFPVWLLPIFYKTIPLADATLSQRLSALCDRAKLSILGVFRVELGAETRKANAALAGFGRTRRVLLSDTLLQQFTPEEIETVLGHELGHQRYRHIGKMLTLAALGAWLAFTLVNVAAAWWLRPLGLFGLADLAGYPMLTAVLSLMSFISLPITHGLSRHFERQADRFAVSVTAQPAAFAEALRKLGALNLADPAPPSWIVWLFYDHPPIAERIRDALRAASAG